MRIVNKILWKYFHIRLSIEKSTQHYKEKEKRMCYAFNCFGHGEKCITKNGSFFSLQDGKEIDKKAIIRYSVL